ncbi:MAG TPA: TadE/TadG family type IV pilus assembly protein [Vitreimonas sp.]|uniref:TadE/TadG family type IV pilus assembly protein n=1 Tax=Vitreimonas sp. TaxID=3069702 RepID=UPI002D3A5CE9|nr:TadE/TadG family type IV pilus assembly protein [Vitreimonas sp.]HYD86598.1 TadE/TadG family type IV pilus assembly protein [Vitreimonas sp.]
MAAAKSSMKASLRRFKRARKGSAAVEFALVVFPFFLFLFGLAEVAMIGFAQTSLNYAVAETARQIRTGEAQMSGASAGDIRQELCDELNKFMIMTCEGNLYLDVDRFDSFTSASNDEADPIQNGEFSESGFGYTPGAPSDIVVVRAYYRWEVMTPMFAPVFSNVSHGQRIMVSTMMFRNEPYQ